MDNENKKVTMDDLQEELVQEVDKIEEGMKEIDTGDKLPIGKFFAWVSRDVSRVIQVIVMGAITIYATSALHMSAALVGTLLMASRIVDGVTDLIAGYIVDNAKSKLGKGRPYELFILGLWFFTWLCFSVPESASTVVKAIWIVLAYTVSQSICLTFLNANGTVYMVRAFKNPKHYVTLSSIGGIASLPLSYMANLMIIDCATYNEYKGLQRMEGTLNAITGFANKIVEPWQYLL